MDLNCKSSCTTARAALSAQWLCFLQCALCSSITSYLPLTKWTMENMYPHFSPDISGVLCPQTSTNLHPLTHSLPSGYSTIALDSQIQVHLQQVWGCDFRHLLTFLKVTLSSGKKPNTYVFEATINVKYLYRYEIFWLLSHIRYFIFECLNMY